MEYFNILKDILLALGAVAALIAVIISIRLYWLQKRDQKVSDIRQKIVKFRYNCKMLDSLITYEIIHEIVNDVVYSRQTVRSLEIILNSLPADLKDINSRDIWPRIITVSVHSPLLAEYESIVRANYEISAVISTHYATLFRVYESIQNMFTGIIHATKEVARQEEIFSEITYHALTQGTRDIETLIDQIYYDFMGWVLQQFRSQQDNIDDALEILRIVNQAFLSLSENKLIKQIKFEKRLKLKDINETETIFADLLEAERGLAKILAPEDLLKYRELCVRIKIRNHKKA